jgi:hypothetical protein
LCSECVPPEFYDGSKNDGGKWHNKFPKEKFDIKKHDTNDYININQKGEIIH